MKNHSSVFGDRELSWLLDQLARVPELDALGAHVESRIEQLAEPLPKRPVSWLVSFIERRMGTCESQDQVDLSDNAGDQLKRDRVGLLPLGFNLVRLIEVVRPGAVSGEHKSALQALLSFNLRRDSIGEVLPRYAARIDPEGVIVPAIVAEKLTALSEQGNAEELRLWSRYGAVYVEDTPAWRIIARSACEIAQRRFDQNTEGAIYLSLTGQDVETWSGPYGELHPPWQQAVDAAREAPSREADSVLRGFKTWKLAIAQAEYERWRGFHEEQQRK